jgi:hypothetical protein
MNYIDAVEKLMSTMEKHHTIDYAGKKSEQYIRKYNIDIQKCEYKNSLIENNTIELICQRLNADNPEPIGFYAYNAINKYHVDAFVVCNGKILIFSNSQSSHVVRHILKEKFNPEKIYVQKPINKYDDCNQFLIAYDFPQKDTISCPVFSLKYLKECLKDNAQMLSNMVQFIQSDNIKTKDNQFILHPYIERYSQSDTYFNKAKQNWNLDNQSPQSDALLSVADAWRSKYDKTRMIYYLLKDLDKDIGYKKLENVKQMIINEKIEGYP